MKIFKNIVKAIVIISCNQFCFSNVNYLKNGNFEGENAPDTYPDGFHWYSGDNRAYGWTYTKWGSPSYSIKKDLSGGHKNSKSQKVELNSLNGGGFLYRQSVGFQKDMTYRGRIWVRSDNNIIVSLVMRKQESPYTVYASKQVTVGNTWQSIDIVGNSSESVDGYFGINFEGDGNIWIDDAYFGTNFLKNSDFEGFGSTDDYPDGFHWYAADNRAYSWSHTHWGGTVFSLEKEIHGGMMNSKAQKISVSSLGSGGYLYRQKFELSNKNTFKGSLWVIALDGPTQVTLVMRMQDFPYTVYASETYNVSNEWKYLSVMGKVPANIPLYFGLYVESEGTLIVDNSYLGTNLLSNPDFESNYSSVQSQNENGYLDGFHTYDKRAYHWKGTSVNNVADYSYSKIDGGVNNGDKAHKISVSLNNGQYYYYQPFDFKKGRTYRGQIKIKSDNNVKGWFYFRRKNKYYDAQAIKTFEATSEWKNIRIEGGFPTDVDGFVGINFLTDGNLYVDGASIVDVSAEMENTIKNDDVIPHRFFGMQINKAGSTVWPSNASNYGLLRLWGSSTRWYQIEPSEGDWVHNRPDLYVNSAHEDKEILFTLGMPPTWATPSGDETKLPYEADWRTYVRHLGERYKGKVKFWEIWNEIDMDIFYSGNIEGMVNLARIANEELKNIDEENKILSPNITAKGLAWLEKLLDEGLGEYIDIISWHRYPIHPLNENGSTPIDAIPEDDIPLLVGINSVKSNYNLDKPIWNTEGAYKDGPHILNDNDERGVIARTYIIYWLHGIENFSWYCWDLVWAGSIPLSYPVSNPLYGKDEYMQNGFGGMAYEQTVDWLVGSKVLSLDVRDGTWAVEIQMEDGKKALIVWNTRNVANYSIPNSHNFTTIKRLDGSQDTFGCCLENIEITTSPILLE